MDHLPGDPRRADRSARRRGDGPRARPRQARRCSTSGAAAATPRSSSRAAWARAGRCSASTSRRRCSSARRRTSAKSGVTNVRFENADAQTHTLPGRAFDLVFSRFGVMFFVDPTSAFRQPRVVASRGRPCGVRLLATTGEESVDGRADDGPRPRSSRSLLARRPTPPDRSRSPIPIAFRRILTEAGSATSRSTGSIPC